MHEHFEIGTTLVERTFVAYVLAQAEASQCIVGSVGIRSVSCSTTDSGGCLHGNGVWCGMCVRVCVCARCGARVWCAWVCVNVFARVHTEEGWVGRGAGLKKHCVDRASTYEHSKADMLVFHLST